MPKGNILKSMVSKLKGIAGKGTDALWDGYHSIGAGAGNILDTIKGGNPANMIAAAIGLSALKSTIADPVVENVKILKSRKDIMKKYPALKDADPKEISDYFNVVKTFSPKAASNPLVAGALVNKMKQFGGVDHKLVQDLASIQKGYQKDIGKGMIDTIAGGTGLGGDLASQISDRG